MRIFNRTALAGVLGVFVLCTAANGQVISGPSAFIERFVASEGTKGISDSGPPTGELILSIELVGEHTSSDIDLGRLTVGPIKTEIPQSVCLDLHTRDWAYAGFARFDVLASTDGLSPTPLSSEHAADLKNYDTDNLLIRSWLSEDCSVPGPTRFLTAGLTNKIQNVRITLQLSATGPKVAMKSRSNQTPNIWPLACTRIRSFGGYECQLNLKGMTPPPAGEYVVEVSYRNMVGKVRTNTVEVQLPEITP